jgi:hypothetical protein
MKRFFLLFVIVFLLIAAKSNASSIWFNNPVNGQTITGAGFGSSQTTVPLNLQWNRQTNKSYYEKLFCSPYPTQQSNIGDGISQWWYLPAGTYTWRLELWEYNELGQAFKAAEETITFYVKHTITVSNNFYGGNINIDNVTKVSGSSITKFTGDNLALGAIDQTYNGQYYLWNQNGTNNSVWKKKPMNGTFANINGGNPRNFNYTVASNDNGAEIQGALRKRFSITRNDQSLESGNTFNSANLQVIEGNGLLAPSPQIVSGITYTFIDWSDGVTENPRIISSSTSPLTARYKAHLGSTNNSVTYKFWQSRIASHYDAATDQKQCMAYESNGEIWACYRNNPANAWGNEVRLSTGNGNNAYPSVMMISGVEAFAVWQRQNGTGIDIYFSRYYYGSWGTPLIIANYYTGNSFPHFLLPVVWACSSTSGSRIYVYYEKLNSIYCVTSSDHGSNWTTATGITGLMNAAVDGTYQEHNLVGATSSGIMYLFTNSSPIQYPGSWTDIEVVPGSNGVDYSGEGDIDYLADLPVVRRNFEDGRKICLLAAVYLFR